MDVKWYGTATVGFTDDKDEILFDPFLRRNVFLKESTTSLDGFTGRSAIFITHGHFDHTWDIPELLKKDTQVTVYCPQTAAESLLRQGVDADRLKVVSHGDQIKIGDFTVRVFRAKHVSFSSGYIASVVPRCTFLCPILFKQVAWSIKMPLKNDIFMYEIENGGKNVLLSGSFGWYEDVAYPENADMFILAHGGSTELPKVSIPFLAKTKPKTVFFTHFDDAFPPLTRRVGVERTVRSINAAFGNIETIIPKEQVRYTVH